MQVPELNEGTLDLEDELNRAMGDASMDELLGGSQTDHEAFEPDSLQTGRVVGIRRDDVFVEFSGRQQGIVSLRQFDVPPAAGRRRPSGRAAVQRRRRDVRAGGSQ